MERPRFIDFHTHPDLKTFFSADTEDKRMSCWRRFNVPLLLQVLDENKFGGILSSQSSLAQLNNRKGTIALAGCMAFEKSMLTGDIFRRNQRFVNLVKIARVLNIIYFRRCLDPRLLDRISSPSSSYFNVFNEAQNHLIESKNKRRGYNLLKRISDYDNRKLNIILTIEGGHNLLGQTQGASAVNEVLDNIDKLKNHPTRRYLFLNPAHLEQNPLCTHAYNMKIISHQNLLPSGKEISPLGREVIKKALSKPGRILIDVKHMSLKARKEYYRILRTDFPNENIPVIASHAAVTGISYQNIEATCLPEGNPALINVRYKMPPGHIAGTRFNPCSINLYDEEIDIIIRSGGIIGLNFDERLLGIKKRSDPDPTEYFSKTEVSCSEFTVPPVGAEAAEEELSLLEQRIDDLESILENNLESFLISVCDDPGNFRSYIEMWRRIRNSFRELQRLRLREERPLLHFERAINHLCNNILHIALVGGSAAWKHICIGSDFDGLINSLEVGRNARKYKSLSEALKIWLPISAGRNAPAYHITDIDSQVDDIMFGNAFRFLQDNFN